MATVRKKHSTKMKVKISLEAIKQQKTTSEITAQYGVHTTQINLWKKQALAIIPDAFVKKTKREKIAQDQQELIAQLYQQIGELVVERDWLKKNSKANLLK